MFNYQKINLLIEEMQKTEKKATVKSIAKSIGIPLSSLNDYKNGKSKMTVDALYLIAKYFKKDMEFFFDEEDKNSVNVVNQQIEDERLAGEFEESKTLMINMMEDKINNLENEMKKLKSMVNYQNKQYGISAEPTPEFKKKKK